MPISVASCFLLVCCVQLVDSVNYLQKARLLRDGDLLPLDAQRGGVDHLVLVDDGAEALVHVRLLVELEDVGGARQLFLRRREHLVDDLHLVGVDRPLAVEAHLRGVLGVLAALVEIAELQGHVVDAVDAGGARRRRSSASSGSGRPGTALWSAPWRRCRRRSRRCRR